MAKIAGIEIVELESMPTDAVGLVALRYDYRENKIVVSGRVDLVNIKPAKTGILHEVARTEGSGE